MSVSNNYTPPPIDVDDDTSLAPGKYVKTLILDRVFILLADMITALQSMTAAMAQRLTFLTNWQQAYTDALNQLRSFIKGNTNGIGGDSTDEMNTRDDLNRINSTFTEQLRGNRSLVGDDAKGLQTNVNQGNDAVNNQINLANAIIQELTQLLGTIYR